MPSDKPQINPCRRRRRRTSERREPPAPRSPVSLSSSSEEAPGPAEGQNTEQDLFKNLVEMVPLIESLMDRKANPSFKRRASMVYTAAPKVADPKGNKATRASSAIKQRGQRNTTTNGHAQSKDDTVGNFSMFSVSALQEDDQKDGEEELIALREQLDELHRLLSEKEEALTSAQESMNQMAALPTTLDELKHKFAEKDLLATSLNSQLSDAKGKLEERQAAIEKLDSATRASSCKVQEVQGALKSMDFENFALMLLFQELSKSCSIACSEDNITSFQQLELTPLDATDDRELKQMEAARITYITALAAAKENASSEYLAAAAEARSRLEAFVF